MSFRVHMIPLVKMPGFWLPPVKLSLLRFRGKNNSQ